MIPFNPRIAAIDADILAVGRKFNVPAAENGLEENALATSHSLPPILVERQPEGASILGREAQTEPTRRTCREFGRSVACYD